MAGEMWQVEPVSPGEPRESEEPALGLRAPDL